MLFSIDRKTPAPLPSHPDTYYQDKWKHLKLDLLLWDSHPDFVKMMVDTGLVFTVVGLYNSADDPKDPPIKVIREMPHLKCQGTWLAWKEFQQQFHFNEIEQKFISTQTAKGWTYTHPNGFIPQDPRFFNKIFPVLKLSTTQYQQARLLAKRFTGDLRKDQTCIVQFYTSPEEPSSNRWRKNWSNLHPVHLGVRVITEKKELYSFGITGNPRDAERVRTSPCITGDCYIKVPDFLEFGRFYKRRVTSIPVTKHQASKILQQITHLNQKGIRFNMCAQNCSSLAEEVMKQLRRPFKIEALTLTQAAFLASPDGEDFPYLGKLGQALQRVSSLIPRSITQNPLTTLLKNSVFYCLGGGAAVGDRLLEEEPFWNNQGISSFSCLYPTWGSLFNPAISTIKHTYSLMQWQSEQPSTFDTTNREAPRIHFLPS